VNKILFFISLILLTSIMSSAVFASVSLHDGWHEYADVFTIDKKVIDIRLSEDGQLLRVKVDNLSGILGYGKCGPFDVYSICYVNKSMDVEQVTISNTGKTMPGVRLTIRKDNEILTDVSATPSISKTYIHEDLRINITIKNSKTQWIEPFKYELIIPPNVTIVNKGEFSSGSGKLVYFGSLSPTSEKTLFFVVNARSPGAHKFSSNLSLETEGIRKSVASSFNLDVGNPLVPTIKLTPENVDLLKESKLDLNIKNIGNLELEISNVTISGVSTGDLDYFAGRGLFFYKPGSCAISQREYLKTGANKDYYMVITPQSLGRFNISIVVTGKYGGNNILYTINKTLMSSANGFSPIFDLSKDAVLSESDFEIYYEIVNTNSQNTFSNVNVDIFGDFINEKLYLDKVNAPDDKVLLRKFIVAPKVEMDRAYKITAVTNYVTQTGAQKQVNTTKTLKVTSNGSLISIAQRATPMEVYPGQEVIVEVTVKNLKDEVFTIGAREIVPVGIEKIGGILLKNFTLRGMGSDSAYIYKIFVPLNTTLTGFNVTAVGYVYSKDFEVSSSLHVKIKHNATMPANVAVPVNNQSGTTSGSGTSLSGGANTSNPGASNPTDGIVVGNTTGKSQPIPDEKPATGFRKFFRSIEKFFSNIFK
jgi:hypothetical protein